MPRRFCMDVVTSHRTCTLYLVTAPYLGEAPRRRGRGGGVGPLQRRVERARLRSGADTRGSGQRAAFAGAQWRTWTPAACTARVSLSVSTRTKRPLPRLRLASVGWASSRRAARAAVPERHWLALQRLWAPPISSHPRHWRGRSTGRRPMSRLCSKTLGHTHSPTS